MCKKTLLWVVVVLLLGSVGYTEDIQWTGLGTDNLWSTPENWNLGRVPTLGDDVRVDVPAAAAPNGPVIQDGIAAQANGIFTEAPGQPVLTITGGSLEVGNWIWWGDGADSFGVWNMSGGTVTVANEFELGWGGGAGTLTMTGGTISAGEAVIPTGSGAFGNLYIHGGTYNVTKPGGLSVKENGLIDITEGTLVLEGDDSAKVNDLIVAGRITAYGGEGLFNLDYDVSNPGKTTLTAIGRVVVLSEDFEGLPLGPNVDEALAGEQVWTDTPPAGWSVDESGIAGIGDPATDGVTEWAGWAFVDKAWWIQAAEDQDRSKFELGVGTVAVADPDEWDDADHPEPNSDNPYDTWLTTPAIDISGIQAGTLQIKFASSWRPEYDNDYHQTANITASFDGGEPVEVMLWESDEASPNYKPYATNETVTIDLQNPAGAGSVVLRFGLFDAGNDWWWAIDNVEVSGLPILPYVYDGDVAAFGPDGPGSLDGTWDHNNGSDAWDGTGIGEGNPGGAAALVEDGVTFLRIQDTGDPRDYGMPDPSNRKVYLIHATDVGLDGARLEFRARVATSAPLDDQHPDGGGGIAPWPAEGIGYHIRDDGKGMFGISDGGSVISFSLAKAGEAGFENVATDVLVMNNLAGTEPSSDVDTSEATQLNVVGIADVTQWNTFVIDIAAGGAGTHVVSVSVNGGPAESFDVTAGNGAEGDSPYIAIGSSGTGGITAFDLDYISVSRPVATPSPSKTVVYDFETGAQGWGDLKDGTATTVVSETHAGGGSQSLRATMDEAVHGQQQGGMASGRDFTVDDADISRGGFTTLSFWYRADDPDFNGKNLIFHWIMSTESWSGGGWYGNGLWGVLIADGQWHQQTVDLSILGANAGGWEGAWGDQTAWDFRDDLLYSFEILFDPSDNTTGSNVYIDDVVFSGP